MNEPAFDPYYKWLGIPPDARPLNYYMLLGVRTFESDVDVICNAADQKMMYVRSFSVGAHAVTSQQILNQLSQAKVCLCDADRRAAYDQQLRANQSPAAPTSVPVAMPIAAATASAQPIQSEAPSPDFAVTGSSTHRRVKRGLPSWVISLGVLVPLLIALFFLLQRHKSIGDKARAAAKLPPEVAEESTTASTPVVDNTARQKTPVEPQQPAPKEVKQPAHVPVPAAKVVPQRDNVDASKRMESLFPSQPPAEARPRSETPSADNTDRDVPKAASVETVPAPRKSAPKPIAPPEKLLTKPLKVTSKKALDYAYKALLTANRFDEAHAYFERRSQSGDEQAIRIRKLLRGLEQSHVEFWKEVGRGVSTLRAGTPLVAANDSTATVVEGSENGLVLFVKGKHHRYQKRPDDGVFCNAKGEPMSYPLAFLITDKRLPSDAAYREIAFFRSLMKDASGPSDRKTPERWLRVAELWRASRNVEAPRVEGLTDRNVRIRPEAGFFSDPGKAPKEEKLVEKEEIPANVVRCKFDFSSLDGRDRPIPCLSEYNRDHGVPDNVHHAKIVSFSKGVLKKEFPLKENDAVLEFDEDWVVFSKDRLVRLKLVMKRQSDRQITIESSAEYRTIKGRTRYFPLSLKDVGERKDKTDRAGLSNVSDLEKKVSQVQAYQKQLAATHKMKPANIGQQSAKNNTIERLVGLIKSTTSSAQSLRRSIDDGLKQSNSFKDITKMATELEKKGYVQVEWVSAAAGSDSAAE